MDEDHVPRWLAWARELQSLGQIGRTFARNEYDVHNFQRITEIAAEIVHHCTGLPQASVLENFQVQPGYATPKVDVRGAIVRDGKILLVQERVDRRWCMPGGWADVGACPAEMIVREVQEESGFDVKPYHVVGVYDANRGGRPMEFYHAYKLVMLCEILGGAPKPSHETLAVDFFGFDSLPPLSGNRTNERHLADVQAHLQDQSLPAAWD